VRRGEAVPRLGLPLRRPPGTLEGTLAQSRPLALQPALELRRVGQEERLEEVPTVEIERTLGLSAVERPLERRGVAPQRRLAHPELFVAAPDEHVFPERAAEVVYRLAQRGTAVLLV
jgi:hypothetical protein